MKPTTTPPTKKNVNENLNKAYKRTRELDIPDEKTKPVLLQLLKESSENWEYIAMDNYSALIDTIYSLEEDKQIGGSSSNGDNTVKNVKKQSHHSNGKNRITDTEKQNGSSSKSAVVITDSDIPPITRKRNYDTLSAATSASAKIQKQKPQPSNGDGKKDGKKIIYDITKGSESVVISLVDDIGTERLPKFTYIPKNIVYQDAYVHVSLARISDEDCCADCEGDCVSADLPCGCARETGGEYAYTKEGLLKEEFLDTCLKMKKEPDSFDNVYCQDCPLTRGTEAKCDGHLIRKFIKECWRKCGCDMMCGNRIVQRGIKSRLEVYFTHEGKGWGLRTLEDLPKGTFVCEYIGEILTNTELYKRNKSSSSERHTYPVTLDADWGSEKELKDEEALCLDATICGNVARFVNHRCEDANLIDIPVEIETPDRHYYHIAFFTLRDVKAMDELTWDYMIDFSDKSHPVKAFRCSCGSELCRDKKTKGSRGKSVERRKIVPTRKQPGPRAVALKRK